MCLFFFFTDCIWKYIKISFYLVAVQIKLNAAQYQFSLTSSDVALSKQIYHFISSKSNSFACMCLSFGQIERTILIGIWYWSNFQKYMYLQSKSFKEANLKTQQIIYIAFCFAEEQYNVSHSLLYSGQMAFFFIYSSGMQMLLFYSFNITVDTKSVLSSKILLSQVQLQTKAITNAPVRTYINISM